MSHTTSLRELERKYREKAGSLAQEADGYRNGRGCPHECDALDREAAAYENAADDIASLIAALGEGQEVGAVACRGYAKLGIGAYLIEHSAESEPAALMLCIASEEEKAGRTVGDLKTFEGERQPIPAEKMTVRIDFANVAGLDALEQQLRILREVHFPASPAHTSEARDAIPEGWALVPMQSTHEQRLAGQIGITTTCAAAVYREMVAAAPKPPSITRQSHDGELPGMWSASDFTGGDPDERSHAARTAEQQAPVAWLVEWTDEDDGETVRVSFEYKRGAENRAAEVGGDARVIPLYTSPSSGREAMDSVCIDMTPHIQTGAIDEQTDRAITAAMNQARVEGFGLCSGKWDTSFPTRAMWMAAIDAAIRQEGGTP